MDWNKWLTVDPQNKLVAAPRVFSNWHARQLRLKRDGLLIATHRIATRRVLFEVKRTKTESQAAKRLMLVALLLILSFTIIQFSSAFNRAALQRDQATKSEVEACQTLSPESEMVSSLKKFQIGNWQVSALDDLLEIGAIHQVGYIATCQKLSISGTLQAFKTDAGWTILRMTPTH